MKLFARSLIIVLGLLALTGTASAGLPDRYIGDSSIYSSNSVQIKPNVILLVDTSRNMGQGGGTEPYDKTITYPGDYISNAIYKQLTSTNFQLYYANVNNASVCYEAKKALVGVMEGTPAVPVGGFGFYNMGIKKTDGSCSTKSSDIGNYYLGNLLNKTQAVPPAAATWTATTAYAVGAVVRSSDPANIATYRCIAAGTSGATEPVWPTTAAATVNDGGIGGVTWEVSATLMEVIKAVLKNSVGALRNTLNIGLATVGPNNGGGWVKAKVLDISPTYVDPVTGVTGVTNYNNLLTEIDDLDFISSNTSMPMNEALYDMMLYYKGENDSNVKIASSFAVFNAPSPIAYSCQKNFVVMLTTGSSTASSTAETRIGDPDGNGLEGRIDDAAKMGYENDLLVDSSAADSEHTLGVQRMQTTVIQMMTSEVADLRRAADGQHGRGDYVLANNPNAITAALLEQMNNIVREAETAFVSPVVPASPENRTYSGKRIYIGFFKPISQKPWMGNIKKFGINSDLQIVSADGVTRATNDDGTFDAGATSYWSPEGDSGNVQIGGVGGKLTNRNLTTNPRQIWTWTGGAATKAMTDSVNQVTPANSANLTALAADPTERANLINFINGFDSYNDEGNGVTEQREYFLGDVLHSKPLVVNFKKFSLADPNNETNTTINRTFIFQGSNDGMMHCFRDADGEEEWAFIPPDLLPRLSHLRDTSHTFYVDGTPSIYIHDANNDANIVAADGDYALLIFGLRRGGGLQSLSEVGFRGGYYLLDVTNPSAPRYVGKITNTSVNGAEMGESWGQPRLARVKVGSQRKIVAFVGAGYDNVEDLRFGSTQSYPPGATEVPPVVGGTPDDFLVGKSTDGGARLHPRGRGIYAIQIADLVPTGVGSALRPDTTDAGTILWGMVYGAAAGYTAPLRTNPALTHSIASDILAIDRNTDGQIDRLYVGDTGGNMWRFNVGDTNLENWNAKHVFSANPGDETPATNGRKIFYRPDVAVVNPYNIMLYFGTGDREHPMNYLSPGASGAVIDRFYAVRDSEEIPVDPLAHPYPQTEADLHDVTTNVMQQEEATPGAVAAERAAIFAPDNFGWYIRLDVNPGEKSLAAVSVFNDVVFYTTYQPDTLAVIAAAADPCDPGNLGHSRLYALRAGTGEAAFNFSTVSGNDQFGENQDATANDQAQGKDTEGNTYVLRRADRELSLGGGIPSGPVFIIGADGSVSSISASDDKFPALKLPGAGTMFPVFWTQW